MPAVAGRHASSPGRRPCGGGDSPRCEGLERRIFLAAELTPPPFVPFDGPPALYQLTAGGNIGAATQVDTFPLGRLRAGDVVTLSMAARGSSRGTLADPLVTLCRAGANPAAPVRVAFNDDDGSGRDALLYRFAVAVEDEYLAEVRSADVFHLGTYALSAWLEAGAAGAPAGVGWRAVTHRSAAAGDVGAGVSGGDYWAYDLSAGDVASVMVRPTSALDAALSVLGPGGAVVAADLGDNGSVSRDVGRAMVLAWPVGESGRYVVRVSGTGSTSGSYDADVYLSREPPPPPASVIARHVFYNNSAYDGRSPAANAADDGAIAADKVPLRPGELPTAANFTGYAAGINGLMIDVERLRADPTPADFTFELNMPDAPGAWVPAPPPAQVARRPGAGAGGSDRVMVTWPDGSIVDRWLRVTLRASGASGVAADDVFLFGNLAGDCGDADAGAAVVNVSDVLRARAARSDQAAPSNPCDFNRDGRVNGVDVAVARGRVGRGLTLSGLWSASTVAGEPPPRSGVLRRRAFEWGATTILA